MKKVIVAELGFDAETGELIGASLAYPPPPSAIYVPGQREGMARVARMAAPAFASFCAWAQDGGHFSFPMTAPAEERLEALLLEWQSEMEARNAKSGEEDGASGP